MFNTCFDKYLGDIKMEQIKIKDLTFFYNKQEKPAIENLSFNIEKGDFVVLCGKSGCGKSTLLRCLKPIIKPYGKTLGDIILKMRNWKN